MQANQAESNTRLPRAVLRRSAEIQQRLDAQKLAAAEANTEPPVDPAPPTEAPDPEVPITDPITPVPPLEPPQDPTPPPVVDWEQRAKTAQGRLTKLAEDHREMKAGFESAIAELQDQLRTLQQNQPPQALDLAVYFTPEQIEQFGEDALSVQLAGAEKRMREVLQESLKPLVDGREQDKQAELAVRKQGFRDRLLELVPDYLAIDSDPEWLDGWLESADEATGLLRGEVLDLHVRNFDADKAAKIFNGFKASRKPRPTPPVVPNGGAGDGSGGVQPRNEPRLLPPTDVEVRDYYKRKALGKVKEAERVEFEARLASRNRR